MPKFIFDNIHKYMEFEDLLIKIIDTPEFQKLRNIKQLGLCYYVFSGASHNRFEHSLGASYLSGLLIEHLQETQPELKITDRQVLLVKIAGLVHDIGHACFSHFFDHYFLYKQIPNSPNKDHEIRSIILFEHIVKKYSIPITDDEIIIIKKMINPSDEDKSFLFQIVSNKINGLDCDKFDYIARDTYNLGLSYSFDCSRLIMKAKVINNIICYPKKCYFDIIDMFHTRYKLHKQIYTHPCVRSLEYMILDIINLTYKELNILEKVNDITKFYKLTDNILDLVDEGNNQEAKEILFNIRKRNLYKLVQEVPRNNIKLKDLIKEINLNKLANKVVIDQIKLNYSMEKQNPMNFVSLYKNNKIVEPNDISALIPKKFQEIIIRFYVKNTESFNIVKDLISKYKKKSIVI